MLEKSVAVFAVGAACFVASAGVTVSVDQVGTAMDGDLILAVNAEWMASDGAALAGYNVTLTVAGGEFSSDPDFDPRYPIANMFDRSAAQLDVSGGQIGFIDGLSPIPDLSNPTTLFTFEVEQLDANLSVLIHNNGPTNELIQLYEAQTSLLTNDFNEGDDGLTLQHFVIVPAPAAAGLLAIGGFAASGRRRQA